MSPNILRELLAIRRTLTTRYAAADPSDQEASFDAMYRNHERVDLLQEAGLLKAAHRVDAVKVLRGSLPYRRYMEDAVREHELEMAAGGRTICPKCGERTVRDRDVITLGYAGHPGAEHSAYYVCESETCDYADLAG